MKKARVLNHNQPAGILFQLDDGTFRFEYDQNYMGESISLTMPVSAEAYQFEFFPPFFDGLLPEGVMLEALLKQAKIDKYDYFQQLLTVGKDLVGSVTVVSIES